MANFLLSSLAGNVMGDLKNDMSSLNPFGSSQQGGNPDFISSMLGGGNQSPSFASVPIKGTNTDQDYQNYADMAKQYSLKPINPPQTSGFDFSSFLGKK